MTGNDLYLLAIALVPGMTADLLEKWRLSETADEDFFKLSDVELCQMLGITRRHAVARASRDEALEKARSEADFISSHSIKTYFAVDEDYPVRVRELSDAPAVIFAVGNGSLGCDKVVSMVGTRKPTPYGAELCRTLAREWCTACRGLTIVSGLAYGIDALSHTEALAQNSPTIAVVAHGLDRVYPSSHRQLARDIAHHDGLILTEYPSGTRPYRRCFLERNRIIAALADATVVVESGYKGGALSTANCAFSLNREVFAVPGRMTDEMSLGCNILIQRNKAHILTSSDDLLREMNWQPDTSAWMAVQQTLFPSLTDSQSSVYQMLKSNMEPMPIDAIHEMSGVAIHTLMSMLADMEFDGVVVKYPGNRYAVK